MKSTERVKVSDLNNLLTCVLCKGYYIDATTIIECLHSFCKTCIVRYLQFNKFCPTCDVQVHKTKPLVNIRSDQTLQDIVYKLVPGLFKNEMKRRRDFYSQKNIDNIPSSSEKRGDVWYCDRLIFTPDDVISVSMEYFPLIEPLPLKLQSNVFPLESLYGNGANKKGSHRRYFRCPGALTVSHFKKLLRSKHNLSSDKKIDILYMHDYLKDQYTLVDLAYIYSWKRSEPLRLFYKVDDLNKQQICVPIPSPIENKQTNSLVENSNVCCPIIIESPSPSMAAAPSSRYLSRPPSPQTAEEPKEIKLEKPNCASMESPQNVKEKTNIVSEPKLKSALKKSVPVSISNSVLSPESQREQISKRKHVEDAAIPTHLSDNRTSKNSVSVKSHKKKKVTFSDFCYNIQFQSKLPNFTKCDRVSLKPVNGSALCSVIHMKKEVLSNKSS